MVSLVISIIRTVAAVRTWIPAAASVAQGSSKSMLRIGKGAAM